MRRALDVCPICELPRFAHDWRIARRWTARMPFREPFPGSPTLRQAVRDWLGRARRGCRKP